jgi:hypothetical protein
MLAIKELQLRENAPLSLDLIDKFAGSSIYRIPDEIGDDESGRMSDNPFVARRWRSIMLIIRISPGTSYR